ncbi:MAG: SHOCT domain-containing protein [Micropruina sp.]|nr:SHOCT domain-containing protein [Micropruina sp.]
MDFWGFFWLMIWGFFFVAYLIVLVQVVIDLFRDDELSGWAKAAWVLALLALPALTALVYLGVRGRGMSARQRGRGAVPPEPSDVQVIQAATPVQQIAHAKTLLDSGAITADEFAAIKARALG